MRIVLPLLLALLTFGCTPTQSAQGSGEGTTVSDETVQDDTAAGDPAEGMDHAAHAEQAHSRAPIATTADGQEIYGKPLEGEREIVALATVLANASQYADQVVRTEGQVSQVCQKMGCWIELTAEGATPVRVPMAGHSFFLPREAAGKAAVVEGTVKVKALTEEERAHYAAEGAQAVDQAVSIEATSVVIKPAH